MKEEQVTKAILKNLLANGWTIVCFDFPQSGTGKVLHPDERSSKTSKALIPDIVAVKSNIAVFFENKDRYYYLDYVKQNNLISHNEYTHDINQLLNRYSIEKIYYGIGLPLDKHKTGSKKSAQLIDFISCVTDDGNVEYVYNPAGIPFNVEESQ